MTYSRWIFGCALLLAACDDTGVNNGSGDPVSNVPEGVAAVADPSQDLTTVRVDPATNCYEYRYTGPVETTFLPLRTVDGRPICKAQS